MPPTLDPPTGSPVSKQGTQMLQLVCTIVRITDVELIHVLLKKLSSFLCDANRQRPG